ncbi:hypothetical protein HOY80DRAFT_1114795 [Tuber brumale]|nr:hypothetical protein HOY80DRAFT_1114795 [Tuber brumale]
MLPKITSAPIINYGDQPLREAILACTSMALGNALNQAWRYLPRHDQEALETNAPADHDECTQVVDAWVTRLQLIRSALADFPTPISPTVACRTAPGHSGPHPASEGGNILERQPVEQFTTPDATKKACLECDDNQCVMTGHKSSDGFKIEVAHIIAPEPANHPGCRQLDFWKMLDIFYGTPANDTLFTGVLDRIHSLQNLISLDKVLHDQFVNGDLTLTPKTDDQYPMHPLYYDVGDYWLSVESNLVVAAPDIDLSRLAGCGGEAGILYQRSKVRMAYQDTKAGQSHTAALPSHFALRASILSPKHICENTPSWEYNLPPVETSSTSTPVSSLNTNDCAIAILEEFVTSPDFA